MSLFSLRTNLSALGTSRNFTAHYVSLADSVRRLSSGLRVERAADDAAGLAIRELMRADVASLHQGARNVDDAISLIQTADGALSVIDEKLIRMKELAEQAATGTYDSTQRLMIDSEFQQMASEIERIARATDFNGIHLLDGSLSGPHDGSQMEATGALKIHFGTGNDSAEDYYYIQIGDATLAGLGLMDGVENAGNNQGTGNADGDEGGAGGINIWEANLSDYLLSPPTLNDIPDDYPSTFKLPLKVNDTESITSAFAGSQGTWFEVNTPNNWTEADAYILTIPKGTKNVLINLHGTRPPIPGSGEETWFGAGDNDIQLFTRDGIHLAGTPLSDYSFNYHVWAPNLPADTGINANSHRLGFTEDDYDGSHLNSGPKDYDPSGSKLAFSEYNGMVIGYSGDPDRYETYTPFENMGHVGFNDGYIDLWSDNEVLFIDEVTEDLVLFCNGAGGQFLKVYWDLPAAANPPTPGGDPTQPVDPALPDAEGGTLMSIKTQELAQKGIVRLNEAIVRKDQIRSHLGAVQNRLENTVTNLNIQAENLQAAESRISDADIATEMTNFVRNQVMTQTATAMLSQANTFPPMLLQLIGG